MKKELELYVHIPFCKKKCAYCDFLSGSAKSAERQEYVEALIKEIEQYRELGNEYEVTTIFLGGGTPSILTGNQVTSIFYALRSTFSIRQDAEITIEMNPGTVDRQKLEVYKEVGINRLSIGLQSVHNEELKLLGRIHTYEEFESVYRLARACGFSNINVDLISAIPGQTTESFALSLGQIAKLSPEHISAYSLIIEEGTPFYELYGNDNTDALAKLPDEDTEREIYQETKDILSQYGYERYEISNYAKPGYACRHNLGYWNRTEYLGIGIGASSLLHDTRYRHIDDREDYVKHMLQGGKVCEMEIDSELLSISARMEEMMFLGLRKMQGVSKTAFLKEFGKTIDEVYREVLNKLVKEGLLYENESRIWLSEKGIDLSNYVMMQFLEPQY